MAPDVGDVDAGDLELARQLVEVAIEYMEQELGVLSSLQLAGRLDRRRLWVLRRHLDDVSRLLGPPGITSSDSISV